MDSLSSTSVTCWVGSWQELPNGQKLQGDTYRVFVIEYVWFDPLGFPQSSLQSFFNVSLLKFSLQNITSNVVVVVAGVVVVVVVY